MTAETQGAEAPKSAVVAAMLAKTTPAPAPAPTEHELEIAHLRAALAESEAARYAAPTTQPSATKQFPKYIMPLSNCNICLPNGKRVFTSDGVIVADSHYLEEYLEEMVAVGNCYRFQEGDAVSTFQAIPK
jgi:hypothetical protein